MAIQQSKRCLPMPNNSTAQLLSNNTTPPNTPNTQATTLRSVGQDKSASTHERIGTQQPAPQQKGMRAHEMNIKTTRSQNKPIPKRKTVSVTLWVKPIVKAELQRLAERDKVSISKAGAAFLERVLQAHIDMQYGALLRPVIENTVRTELRRYFSRMILFLARITMTLDVMKGLVKWLCRRLAGATKEQVDAVETRSRTDARVNFIKRTPQLEAITQELEKTLMEGII